ncbi:MAG: RAD55 family ATPase [Haloarculaceae archaeon]
MERVPFGIRRLDTTISGGAPPGSVVLLSGEAGAGAREFMYTSAVMGTLAQRGSDLFDLYYGDLPSNTTPPEEVHYVSFTADQAQVRREMELAMDAELVEECFEDVTFHNLSAEYFRLSPVPRDWYTEELQDITGLGEHHERQSVTEALGDRLNEHGPNNLVVIDSLTDLLTAPTEDLESSDLPLMLRGLAKAAFEWGGLILAHVGAETLSAQQLGLLVNAADGTFSFEWEAEGSARDRTMVVRQFRGVLSQIEDENIVRFETDIGDAGFDISDVRKIR